MNESASGAAGGIERRLAAIMFTDIVGYSLLTQRDEARALSQLAEHNRLVRSALAEHDGKEIKTAGDSFLVEFPSALSAVQCAVSIQQALRLRSEAARGDAIEVRIGIHLGDVVYREGDILGDGVNIASRIQSTAQASGIHISEDVARQVRNKIQWPLSDLGMLSLKNIAQPVHVFAVDLPWRNALGGTGPHARRRWTPARWLLAAAALAALIALGVWWQLRGPGDAGAPASGTARSKTIAVLPFVNLVGNKEDDYLGDGLTEDLLTELAQIADLTVVSRTSVLQYKGSKKPMREIARELGVAHILEGSVRRSEKHLRINAQLIDAQNDKHLWARTYDRDLKDILVVQSEVTSEIARSLRVQLLSSEKQHIERRSRTDPDAYIAYLKGSYIVRPGSLSSKEEFDPAVPFFMRAIELAPESPIGYVGMAKYHVAVALLGVTPSVQFTKADGYVTKALSLDPQSVDAYLALAEVRSLGQWDWKGAGEAAKRATEISPGSAMAWSAYATRYLDPLGRLDEAIDVQRRAVDLDPANSFVAWLLSQLYVEAGRCEEAMALARGNIERWPTYANHRAILVSCLETAGRLAEAIEETGRVDAYWAPGQLVADLRKAYAQHGPKGYWETKLAFQLGLARTRNDALGYAAEAAAHLGNWDLAFELLARALELHDRYLHRFKNKSAFFPRREDPRYISILKTLNLQ